ncbi:MAG TPA: hypothetical protein VEY68_01925 [Anoxybacillus sp.]|nr:hypothetical protein [Anoxybacillus sp.]
MYEKCQQIESPLFSFIHPTNKIVNSFIKLSTLILTANHLSNAGKMVADDIE